LYDGHNTTRDIAAEFERKIERDSFYDQVFVYLSLPRHPGSDGGEFAVAPPGADPQAPWTFVTLALVADWLAQLPSRNVMLVFPACPWSTSPWAVLERAPGRAEALTAVITCDLKALDSVRDDRTPESLEPGARRSAQVAARWNEVLQEAAELGRLSLSRELFRELGTWGGLEFMAERVPSWADDFVFVPAVSDVEPFRERYATARTADEAHSALIDFLDSVWRSDPVTLPAAVALLEEIAVDPTAARPPGGEPTSVMRLRYLAVNGLRDLATDVAWDALERVAKKAEDAPQIRAMATFGLSRTYRDEDLEAIIDLTGDDDPIVREAAIRAAAIFDDEAAAPAVRVNLAGEQPTPVRLAAVDSLAALGGREDRPAIGELLEDEDASLRAGAALAVGRLCQRFGPADGVNQALLARLRDDTSDEVRRAVAVALGLTWQEAERRELSRGLIHALEKGPDPVTAAAALTLGRHSVSEAEAPLSRMLGDETRSLTVRAAAAEALGDLGSSSAAESLSRAARANLPPLRRSAVTALGRIGTEVALRVVLTALGDSDSDVRSAAVQALSKQERIQPGLLDEQSGSMDAGTRVAIVNWLQGRTEDEAVNFLIDSLDDEDYAVREAAISALSEHAGDSTGEAVVRALSDGSPRTRLGAVRVLAKIGDESTVHDLAARASDSLSAVRAEAVRSMARFDSPEALDTILGATQDSDPAVRRASVEALTGRDTGQARQYLAKLAEDPSPEVSKAAIYALSGVVAR
jgi:HEAT repeat protein